VPYFGICLGLQTAVIEIARNLAGLEGANSSEFEADTPYPVIDLLPDQRRVADKGGTMRLGLDPCRLLKGTLAERAYGDGLVFERHRHRFEVNNRFRRRLEAAGLVFSGTSPDGRLVEMIELPDHPWFVASQFHPEFRSRPTRPHPLFRDFVGAATAFADGRDRPAAAPAPAPAAPTPAPAAPTPAPAVRSDGIAAHRNGGEHARTPDTPEPYPPAAGAPEREGSRQPAGARTAVHSPAPTGASAVDAPPVPRVPIVDANPRPDPGDRFATTAEALGTQPAPAAPERPAVSTVDLRGDGPADPAGHDDDPSVPAGPVTAGEPGRP